MTTKHPKWLRPLNPAVSADAIQFIRAKVEQFDTSKLACLTISKRSNGPKTADGHYYHTPVKGHITCWPDHLSWKRTYQWTPVVVLRTTDELAVALAGHEVHHWAVHRGLLPGPDSEERADALGAQWADEWRAVHKEQKSMKRHKWLSIACFCIALVFFSLAGWRAYRNNQLPWPDAPPFPQPWPYVATIHYFPCTEPNCNDAPPLQRVFCELSGLPVSVHFSSGVYHMGSAVLPVSRQTQATR